MLPVPFQETVAGNPIVPALPDLRSVIYGV